MAVKEKKADFISTGLVAHNRRAGFDYFINEKFVAGLELSGTEVKSLRLGHANINDAFGVEKTVSCIFPTCLLPNTPTKATKAMSKNGSGDCC